MASDANLSKAQVRRQCYSFKYKPREELSMKGGKEELSYANNSKAQAKHANSMLHLLKETPDRVQLSSPEFPFVVADLGCSIPGSFYRRLFPSRSIDLFHSAFSLHWLSQVINPLFSVLDKRSAAYNKGRVSFHGANESTANAYKKQFQTDLASFLRVLLLVRNAIVSTFLCMPQAYKTSRK
ncbi:unnamed protein product [Prunus brigantina]